MEAKLPFATQGIQGLLICLITLLFFIWERKFPGRELPEARGWYLRAVAINRVTNNSSTVGYV